MAGNSLFWSMGDNFWLGNYFELIREERRLTVVGTRNFLWKERA